MLDIRKEKQGKGLFNKAKGNWSKYSFRFDIESGDLEYYGDVNKVATTFSLIIVYYLHGYL